MGKSPKRRRARNSSQLPAPGRPDYVLIAVLGVLLLLGLLMIYSATAVDQMAEGTPLRLVRRQLQSLGIGLAGGLVISRIPYRFWRGRILPWMVLCSFIMLSLLLFPNPLRGEPGPGGIAYRWLLNGPLRFQPSELSKFAMIAFAANFLDRRVEAMQQRGKWLGNWLAYWGVIGITALMIIKQPDLGTALVILAVGYLMLLAAGMNLWAMVGTAVLGAAGVLLFAVSEPYRLERITSWLDPWPLARDSAYQAIQGFVALARGGLLGVGLGRSTQKLGNLPEHHTDYILAVLGEEFGLAGTLFLLLLYAMIAWRGFRIARLAPDRFGTLLATGLTTLVVFQGFLNVGVISGLLPVTGVPLPFMSYGGTSLIVNLATISVLVGISRYRRDPGEESESPKGPGTVPASRA